MAANYQHPVDFSMKLIIAYPRVTGYATLHKSSCSHVFRDQMCEPRDFAGQDEYYSDDWFEVAPCARLKKGKKNE